MGFDEDDLVVRCDSPGCGNAQAVTSRQDAASVVADDGWVLVAGTFLCPEHRERRPWLA